MNLCLKLLHPPLYAANTGPGLAGPHEEGDGEDSDEPQQVVTGHRLPVRIVYKGGQACTDRSGSLYYPGDVIIVNTRISRRVTIVTQCHNCDALCHNCHILFVKMLELGSEIIPKN